MTDPLQGATIEWLMQKKIDELTAKLDRYVALTAELAAALEAARKHLSSKVGENWYPPYISEPLEKYWKAANE